MTGLRCRFKRDRLTPYDTSCPSVWHSSPSTVMDDTPVGKGRRTDNRPPLPLRRRAWSRRSTSSSAQKLASAMRVDRLFARHLPAFASMGKRPAPEMDARRDGYRRSCPGNCVPGRQRRIESFEPRHEGALQAYLRQAIVNRIRDEVRRGIRAPLTTELDENQTDHSASPAGAGDRPRGGRSVRSVRWRACGPTSARRFVARIEMDCSYEEVAQALDKPSPDAARMAVSRALLRLAEEMNRAV